MAIQINLAPQMTGIYKTQSGPAWTAQNANESNEIADSFISSDAQDAFLSFKPYRNGAATVAYGGDSPKVSDRVRNAGAPAIDLDPETTRKQKNLTALLHLGETYKAQVATGKMTGADAGEALFLKASNLSGNNAEFFQYLQGMFIPNIELPDHGVSRLLTGIPCGDLLDANAQQQIQLPSTGYAKKYKETAQDGSTSDMDQTHHLVFFLATGYNRSGPAGQVGAELLERHQNTPYNTGDINLGKFAAGQGADLRYLSDNQKMRNIWVSNLFHGIRND